MNSRGDLANELRTLIEGLHPDLRKHFRPSLLGKVVAVHDDDEEPESYYRVDVVVGPEPGGQTDEESDEPGLSLPNVPVASLFAQDGYGIFALPEVGAEVTVSFHDGDITRPYVESPIFYGNKAPAGFTSGTIAIRGKQGQKIELKPDVNEIVLSCSSLKLITTDKRQEHTVGDEIKKIQGKRQSQVDGAENISCDSWKLQVHRNAFIQCGTLTEHTKGNLSQNIGGSFQQKVLGSVSQQIAGGQSVATTFNKREVVGGGYEILVAATPGIAPAAPLAAYQVLVNSPGFLALDAMGGQINIGANIPTPPTMINIGSAASGPVQLGGITAAGQPAACGIPLQTILTTILTVLKTVPLGIGNLGTPIAPNPAVATALAAADAALAQLLSTKVFISQV